jgi:hypothetical protein
MKSLISSRTFILASPVKLHKMAWTKLLDIYFSTWKKTYNMHLVGKMDVKNPAIFFRKKTFNFQ